MLFEPLPFTRIGRSVGSVELDEARRLDLIGEAGDDQRAILEHDRRQIGWPAPSRAADMIASLSDNRRAVADRLDQAAGTDSGGDEHPVGIEAGHDGPAVF